MSTRFHTIGLHNLVKKTIRPGSKVRITVGPWEKKKVYYDYSKHIDTIFNGIIKDICLEVESAIYDFPEETVSLSVIEEGSNFEMHHFIHGQVGYSDYVKTSAKNDVEEPFLSYRDHDNSPCSN